MLNFNQNYQLKSAVLDRFNFPVYLTLIIIYLNQYQFLLSLYHNYYWILNENQAFYIFFQSNYWFKLILLIDYENSNA